MDNQGCLGIQYLPLSSLSEYFLERNGKRHDIETIARSIMRYGFRDPLAIDAQLNQGRGGVAEGNGRLEALLFLKEQKSELPRFVGESGDDWLIPVIVGGDSSDESEGKAYAIDHNLSTLLGSGLKVLDMTSLYEPDILLEVVGELDIKPLSLSDDDWLNLGQIEKDLSEIGEPEFDVGSDENNEETQVHPGEVWRLGRHFLICGDSTDPQTLDRLRAVAQVEFVDLLLTDPPYNVGYVGKTEEAMTIKNDEMDEASFSEFLAAAFCNADRLLRPGGVFYVWHADTVGMPFRSACRAVGWELRQCLIWVKNAFVLGRQDYHWQHEPCLYGWKSGAGHLWNSDRSQSTVLEFDRPQRNGDHPTMKPVQLLAYQIQNSTRHNDWVLDLFLGSGSTLLACEETGRSCLGIELSPKFCDVILRRWEELTAKKAERLA